jgi:cell division protein FtsB
MIGGLCVEEQRNLIDERVEAEAVPFAVAGVDLNDLPVEVVQLIETVVKADRRRIYAEHAEEIQKIEAGAEERELQLRRQNEELQQRIVECEAEIKRLEDEVIDTAKKRDAAVARYEETLEELTSINAELKQENEELQREIERLNSQIDDMRKAQVWGERQAQSIIDVTAEEQEEIQKRVEAVRKLYTHRDDTFGTLVKVTDETGKTHVISREEADTEWAPIEAPAFVGGESFRQEDSAADAGDGGVSAAEAVEGFQAPEVPSDLSGADHHTANGTMDDTPVTRAEFEELKARVDRLEQQQAGAAA